MTTRNVRTAAGIIAGGAALAGLGYAALAGAAYLRYGHPRKPRTPDEHDPLLDQLMPLYDIVERHAIRVAAPAEITLFAARQLNVRDSGLVRAVFKGRELMMGSEPVSPPLDGGIMQTALAMGWGILAHAEGREIVLGAVTKPWQANPVFEDLLPRDFIAFAEPDYVKIAWTLRADPAGEGLSIFRTETRAVATDMESRAKFRRYWALVSPGVAVIRRAMLHPIKAEAEQLAATQRCSRTAIESRSSRM